MNPTNQGIDEKLFAAIIKTNAQAPFYRLLGISTRALGPGCAEMAVLTESTHGNPLGLTHGGLIMTLADAAMANAIRATGKKAVTVNCDVSFLASAPVGREIVGRGKVDRAGGRLGFASAELICDQQVIATSQGTFYVVGEIELD